MVKKISPHSLLKISKQPKIQQGGKNLLHQQQQQFNSLLNVLKPKVYITHPSTFKSLVQQLTGLDEPPQTTTSDDFPSPLSSSSSYSSSLPQSHLLITQEVDHFDDDDLISEYMLMNHQQEQEHSFWDNQAFESWFLDMESPDNSYMVQPEVSIYDYELP